MSLLPYPPGFGDRLKLAATGNRSLLFDRAMDRYEHDEEKNKWSIAEGGKEGFLQAFVQKLGRNDDFGDFVARRSAALQQLGARETDLFTESRLLVGLGLPHPIETGFLFDRLTGCPYLPGSSVKGLLRATARLVMEDQEIEGDRDFWTREQVVRIFGPELAAGVTPRTGCISFYDAFPTAWPALEVDVLTPHYGKHYRKEDLPADWDKPVPVPFLAIPAGTPFRFHFASRDCEAWANDFPQLQSLLRLGLEWLGIGAKKAAGYGVFVKDQPKPRTPAPPTGAKTRPPKGDPPPPPPPPPPVANRWQNVELGWHQGSPAVIRGKQVVPCSRDLLEKDLLEALRDRRSRVKADVVVVKISGGGFRIDKIESWKRA